MLAYAFVVRADAAQTTLNVAISPDVAHMVREWRRAHGLPQGAEAALPRAVTDGHGAIGPALRLLGIEDPSRAHLRISVVRDGAHWQVKIETPGEAPDYVVEVADSIANPTAL